MMQRGALLLLGLIAISASQGCSPGQTPAEGAAAAQPDVLAVELYEVGRGTITETIDLVGTLYPVRATTIVADVDGKIKAFPFMTAELGAAGTGDPWSRQQLAEIKLRVSPERLAALAQQWGIDPSEISRREPNVRIEGDTLLITLGSDVGLKVRKGEELVKIDDTDFRLARDLAQAHLELAELELEKLEAGKRPEERRRLEAQVEKAEAALEPAKAELARLEETRSRQWDAVSETEYDAAKLNVKNAEAMRKEAKAMLEAAQGPSKPERAVAEARVKAAQAELALRQEKLDKTVVRAPYDAVIANRFVNEGDRVTALPRVEIMQIMDPRIVFARVNVPQRYQRLVQKDQEAEVEIAGADEGITGVVELVSDMIEPTTRTFRVDVAIDNLEGRLKPGGFARVQLPVRSAESVPLVPVDAVTFSEGRPGVFVYEEQPDGDRGVVRRRDVKLGLTDREHYEVLSGLAPGERIVIGSTALLTDGLAVRSNGPESPEEAHP